MSKQALEQYVMDTLGEVLNLRMHPGSGNLRGDGDLGPAAFAISSAIQLGFECKDKAGDSHSVPTGEWKKAKVQLGRRGLDPVFVTRNSNDEVLVHMDISVLKLFIELFNELS